MYRAFSILYYLILFVLLSKKNQNLTLCDTRMNHMRDTGYTLEIYDKVRHDSMKIIKEKACMKKKSLFTKEHNNNKKCNSKFMASLNFFV